MIRLVVDTRLAEGSGIGVYLRQLLPRIARQRPHWALRLLLRADARVERWIEDLPNVEALAWPREPLAAADLLGPGRSRLREASAFWVPHFNAPWACPLPLIVTLHDALAFAQPDAYGGRIKAAVAQALTRRVAARATLVLCPSRFTLDALAGYAGLDERKTRVTPLAARRPDAAASSSGRIREPYVLFVGNLKRHKNLGALVAAYATIAARVPHHLRIVGAVAGLRGIDAEALAAARSLGERVHVESGLTDAEVWQRLDQASLLVLPSLHEGFGLPVLEAMAAGCPVVASRAGALPEVAADAALYFDPAQPDELARRIEDVLCSESLAQELRSRGARRVAQFSWDETARLTVEAIEACGRFPGA